MCCIVCECMICSKRMQVLDFRVVTKMTNGTNFRFLQFMWYVSRKKMIWYVYLYKIFVRLTSRLMFWLMHSANGRTTAA